jgi:hypothetical protein
VVSEHELAGFWRSIMDDPEARLDHRIEASKLLADRGWGKAADHKPIEDADPLGLDEARATLLEKLSRVDELAARRKSPENGSQPAVRVER